MSQLRQDNCCENESEHPSHKKQLSRLNRASGQLDGVKRMIEERRYCPEILTQLKAVRSALKSLESEILKTHLRTCVTDALSSSKKPEREKKIEELIEIFYRYE